MPHDARATPRPPGVFNILEKKETHYSKKYDNAPMPNMQRLTWTGIAMHSGHLLGDPASHGCIRLPYDFSALLFDTTSKGGTVVIGDGRTPQPHVAPTRADAGTEKSLHPGGKPAGGCRVEGEGRGVTAKELASWLRFSPEFAHQVADAIAPGTTVIVTDVPAVRKAVVDSTYFAAN